jgi:hypothetical protein
MLSPVYIIDPEAPITENVEAVLAYLDESAESDAFDRAQAARTCERHRGKILRGDPPYPVLHAVERGVAPTWVVDTLRRRFTTGDDTPALAAA